MLSTLTPEAQALLDTISGPESKGSYSIIYGGNHFQDYSDHPRINVPIKSGPHKGEFSSAAGKYQILKGTWDKVQRALKLPDFSPASQDRAAIWIAKDTYKKKTGRDLQTDLASGDETRLKKISTVLHGQWTSLPGGIEAGTTKSKFANQYKSALAKVAVSSPLPKLVADAGSGVAPMKPLPAPAPLIPGALSAIRLAFGGPDDRGVSPFGAPDAEGLAMGYANLAKTAAIKPADSTEYAKLPSGKLIKVGPTTNSMGQTISVTRGPDGNAIIGKDQTPWYMKEAGSNTIVGGIVRDQMAKAKAEAAASAPKAMESVSATALGALAPFAKSASKTAEIPGMKSAAGFIGDIGSIFNGFMKSSDTASPTLAAPKLVASGSMKSGTGGMSGVASVAAPVAKIKSTQVVAQPIQSTVKSVVVSKGLVGSGAAHAQPASATASGSASLIKPLTPVKPLGGMSAVGNVGSGAMESLKVNHYVGPVTSEILNPIAKAAPRAVQMIPVGTVPQPIVTTIARRVAAPASAPIIVSPLNPGLTHYLSEQGVSSVGMTAGEQANEAAKAIGGSHSGSFGPGS